MRKMKRRRRNDCIRIKMTNKIVVITAGRITTTIITLAIHLAIVLNPN